MDYPFEKIIDLQKILVNINSDSYNKNGILENFKIILKNLDKNLKTTFFKDFNNPVLIIENQPQTPKYKILLVGHIDTVFKSNWGEFTIKGKKVIGPGTIDMKAGISMIIGILNNFAENDQIYFRAIINSDEEIGSRDSYPIFKKYSKNMDFSLVFEGVREEQGIIIKRKGITEIEITSTGKAAHAGSFFFKGDNAIIHLIKYIDKIYPKITKLYNEGVTFNLAKIEGGDKMNIVPDLAKAYFDFRYFNIESLNKMKSIIVDEPHINIKITDKRSPMNSIIDEKIIELLREAYDAVDEYFHLDETGGASDGNFISSFGIKVIDGLGPRGGGDHTHSEYFILDSYKKRYNALLKFFTILESYNSK